MVYKERDEKGYNLYGDEQEETITPLIFNPLPCGSSIARESTVETFPDRQMTAAVESVRRG